MGERLLCKQEVIGSIPFTSTSCAGGVKGAVVEKGGGGRQRVRCAREGRSKRPGVGEAVCFWPCWGRKRLRRRRCVGREAWVRSWWWPDRLLFNKVEESKASVLIHCELEPGFRLHWRCTPRGS